MNHRSTSFPAHGSKVLDPHPDVRQELFRLRNLLSEAAAVLDARFDAIHALTQRHVALTLRAIAGRRCGAAPAAAATGSVCVDSGATPLEDDAASLALIADEYERHVAAIVTTLQFQDLADQSLDRAMRMLAAPGGATPAPDWPRDTANAPSGTAQAARSAGRFDAVRRTLRSPVSPVRLASGDIEIF